MKERILHLVASTAEAIQAGKSLGEGKSCVLTGLDGTAKAVFAAALDRNLGEKGSLVFLVTGRDAIREYRQTLAYLYPDLPMQELYPTSLPRVMADSRNLEVRAGRSAALRMISGESRGIVFVTAEAWLQKQARPSAASALRLTLSTGQKVDQMELIEKLANMGYERTDEVDAIGHFAVRGEILDVYPLDEQNPVRLEWFDDEIDGIRFFDIDTKRSIENIDELKIPPLQIGDEEEIFDAPLSAYQGKDTLVFLDEPLGLKEMAANLYREGESYRKELFTPEELWQQAAESRICVVSALEHNEFPEGLRLQVPVRRASSYNRSLDLLVEDLQNLLAGGIRPYIMMTTAMKARGTMESLDMRGVPAVCICDDPEQDDAVNVGFGELFNGFRFWNENWILLTENDIYGLKRRHRFQSKHKGAQIQYFKDIKGGDFVVHDIQGIGRYEGVETIEVDGVHRDYLLLRYAGDDKLYVPVDQVGMLHKYVGAEGVTPRLSKMGGKDWSRMKKRASTAITLLAEELLRLYANRKITNGHAFGEDTPYQHEFEEKFPYEETPDQLKAIAEIKADMEKPVPMDRLLCGDVGYGKTEVAIRAAFKCVMDGKQVAVLVPTTVLAQQHYITFTERMEAFGLRIGLLSRFCSPQDTKKVLERLEEGQVDILIGTHRLLQEDVTFRDLGLLIIDEEQRFGVAQKEKIKQWKTGIDVLTLSATPIPRTLHMALVNGRDMSVIESPPEDRLPVETYVAEYSDGMIREALERELRRGGRIYYVHNRVSGLLQIAGKLRKLVPGIKVRIAHGQMNEAMLEEAMMEFYEGSCDVLLSTTIIENGLDVPMANTIIIDGAENFGLSQLYQMRGRVGRSSRLAYAYFVYKKNKVLSEVATKRLQAIRDFTELGAGFKIAMRDLEIRGAGNLLGPQQHGYIAGIGFAAYCDMLEHTIQELKSGKTLGPADPDPYLDLGLNAYIPDDYISNPRYKLELYRRFVDMAYGEENDLLDEIIDRFGTPPEEVELLWQQAIVRSICRLLRVRGVSVRNGRLRVTFLPKAHVDGNALVSLVQHHPDTLSFRNGLEPQLIGKVDKLGLEPLDWLKKYLPTLLLNRDVLQLDRKEPEVSHE